MAGRRGMADRDHAAGGQAGGEPDRGARSTGHRLWRAIAACAWADDDRTNTHALRAGTSLRCGTKEVKLVLSETVGDPSAIGAALLPLRVRYFLKGITSLTG